MLAILSLLTVIALSLLVTRVAAISLIHTGMTREVARFQARSAFTGAGFTTAESEQVVNHPVRRRIVMALMLLGNAGIVTAITSLMLSFIGVGAAELLTKLALLIAGIVTLWLVAVSRWFDHRLSRLVTWALRRYTRLDVQDYASLLHLAGEYRVTELAVQRDDWLADRCLRELALRDEGVLVLGVNRADGSYIGTPDGDTRVVAGDSLILYGRTAEFERVDRRRKGRRGDRDHVRAVREQERIAARERPLRTLDEEPSGGER